MILTLPWLDWLCLQSPLHTDRLGSEAYFTLKLASQAKVSNQTTSARIIFMQIQESSQVIPLPGCQPCSWM